MIEIIYNFDSVSNVNALISTHRGDISVHIFVMLNIRIIRLALQQRLKVFLYQLLLS